MFCETAALTYSNSSSCSEYATQFWICLSVVFFDIEDLICSVAASSESSSVSASNRSRMVRKLHCIVPYGNINLF